MNGSRLNLLRIPVIASALAMFAASCSFVLDFSADQCESAADCAEAFGLEGAACVDNVCVASTGEGGGGGGGVQGCVSNQQCVDDNDQLPYMCRRKGDPCVSLLSSSCERVYGDFTDEDAVVFGFLGPFDGAFAFTGDDQIPVLELFTDEVESFGPGLPGGPNGARRPIVIVVCDESVAGIESTTHLIENVKVPIIVGPAFSTPLLDVANLAIQNDVFMLATAAGSPLLLDLQDEGLIWSVETNAVANAQPYKAVLSEVETAARAAQAVPTGTDIKVAHTVSGDVVVQSTANSVTQTIEFNGMPALDNGTNYQRFEYGDPTEGPVDLTPVVVEILNMEPNVIILQGQIEIYEQLMRPLEENWPMGVERPFYISEKQGPEFVQVATDHPDAITRHRGFQFFEDKSSINYQSFAIEYRSVHPMGIDPPPFAENVYDALYLAAYATMAIGSVANENLTGTAYAKALPLLNAPGTTINVGGDDFQQGTNLLLSDQDGGDFVGTTGPMEFDELLGSPRGIYEVWCMDTAFEYQHAGQFYDPTSEQLQGTFECPAPM